MQAEQYELHAAVEARHWWFTARRRIVVELVRHVVPRGGRVLDVGCGTGANVAALAQAYECRGLDASARAIELARARFPAVAYDRVDDPAEAARRAADVDGLLLMDVLEHVEDDFLLLSSLLGALRPGAHAVLTVPADPDLWSAHDEAFGHFRRYDARRLRRLWEGLPVRERLCSPYNARLDPLVRLARAANRRLGRTSGASGTDFRVPPAPLNRLLEALFAGEAAALLGSVDRGRPAYRRGVSLVALLRREEGTLAPRTRPADLAPDAHYRRGAPGPVVN